MLSPLRYVSHPTPLYAPNSRGHKSSSPIRSLRAPVLWLKLRGELPFPLPRRKCNSRQKILCKKVLPPLSYFSLKYPSTTLHPFASLTHSPSVHSFSALGLSTSQGPESCFITQNSLSDNFIPEQSALGWEEVKNSSPTCAGGLSPITPPLRLYQFPSQEDERVGSIYNSKATKLSVVCTDVT